MRKESIITIQDRDRELTFKIKEMPALQLESWITRAGLLLAGTGILDRIAEAPNIADDAEPNDAGAALTSAGKKLLQQGFKALGGIEYEKARPLYDELLACCWRIDAGVEQQMKPEVVEGIVQDVKTLFRLRKEAFLLNMSFFGGGGQSALRNDGTAPEGQQKPKISVRSRR